MCYALSTLNAFGCVVRSLCFTASENTRPPFVFSVIQNESGKLECFVRPSVGASQQSRQ